MQRRVVTTMIMTLSLVLFLTVTLQAAIYKGAVSDSGTSGKLDSVLVKLQGTALQTYTNSQGQFTIAPLFIIDHPLPLGPDPVVSFDKLSGSITWSGNHTVALTMYAVQGAVVASSAPIHGAGSYAVPHVADGIYILETRVDGIVGQKKMMMAGHNIATITPVESFSGTTVKTAAAGDTLVFTKSGYIGKKLAVATGDTNLAVKLLGDGSAHAPAGVLPQHPGWLNGYAQRPSWKVAGVDYGVGYPAATVLKNPATIKVTGVDADTMAHCLWINTSNITLDSYDFSLNGGWQVIVGARGTADNTIIKNSNFKVGANNNGPVTIRNGATTATYVGYCVIDGSDLPGSDWMIFDNGGAGLTAEYNWFKNSVSDHISVGGGGAIIIRYNLMEQNGTPGAHPDWLQQLGTNFTNTSVLFNTAYENSRAQGTQGFMVEGTQNAEIGYNTMMAIGPMAQVSYFTGMGLTVTTNIGTVHDNYVDPSSAYGLFYGNPPANILLYKNINMVTGAALP